MVWQQNQKKLADVKQLLQKHFGEHWETIEILKTYKEQLLEMSRLGMREEVDFAEDVPEEDENIWTI